MILALLALIVPLFPFPHGEAVLLVIVSARLVYEGATRAVVWQSVLLLMLMGLIYGMSLGVLPLAYLVAVALFVWTGRRVALTPYRVDRVWAPRALVQAVLAGGVLTAVMEVGTIALAAVLYGRGEFGLRLAQRMGDASWYIVIVIAMTVILVVLHRRSLPFRQTVQYGESTI